MAQHDRAVLVVSLPDRTCKFTFRNNLRVEHEFGRQYLLGDRGGVVNEVARRLDESGATSARRSFWLDGGGGSQVWVLTTTLVANTNDGEALQWGDGSSDPNDPADTTEYDATGSDPVSQAQIFESVQSSARLDSESPAVLHIGEHADGSEIEAGVLNPIEATIKNTSWMRASEDSPSTVMLTATVRSVASTESVVDAIENTLE